MKLLQAVIAVLTVLLFLARQKVYCGVCPIRMCKVKTLGLPPCYCSSSFSSSAGRRADTCARASPSDDDMTLGLPKYKKDPKISVDNEDIDYPVENGL